MGIITRQHQQDELHRYYFNKTVADVFELISTIAKYNECSCAFDLCDYDDGGPLNDAAKLISLLIEIHIEGPAEQPRIPPELASTFDDLLCVVHKLLLEFELPAVQAVSPGMEETPEETAEYRELEANWPHKGDGTDWPWPSIDGLKRTRWNSKRSKEIGSQIEDGIMPTIYWADTPCWRVWCRDEKFEEEWDQLPAEYKSSYIDESGEEFEFIEDAQNAPKLARDPKFFLSNMGAVGCQILEGTVRFTPVSGQDLLAIQKAAHTFLGWQIEQAQSAPPPAILFVNAEPRQALVLTQKQETRRKLRQIIVEAGKRLTTNQMHAVYERNHSTIALSTIKGHLAAMIELRTLTNNNDGKGYGLPEWEE